MDFSFLNSVVEFPLKELDFPTEIIVKHSTTSFSKYIFTYSGPYCESITEASQEIKIDPGQACFTDTFAPVKVDLKVSPDGLPPGKTKAIRFSSFHTASGKTAKITRKSDGKQVPCNFNEKKGSVKKSATPAKNKKSNIPKLSPIQEERIHQEVLQELGLVTSDENP